MFFYVLGHCPHPHMELMLKRELFVMLHDMAVGVLQARENSCLGILAADT
jgi:hypothetical protein